MAKFDIFGLKEVKTLVELLNKYADSLPVELKKSLNELADCDNFEIDCEQINLIIHHIDKARGNDLNISGKFKLVADGEEIKYIKSINPILKRVSFSNYKDGNPKIKDGAMVIGQAFPSKMKMTYRDVTLAEW